MDAEPLHITEGELAQRLGVSREVLIEIRTHLLVSDQDWARKKNAVVYFQSGVDAACVMLKVGGIVLGPVAPTPQAPAAAVNPWTTGIGSDMGIPLSGIGSPEAGKMPAPHVDEPEAQEKGADMGGPRTVYVRRRARANSRMIFVTLEKSGGEEFAVRVRAAKLFVPGQQIQISPSGQDGLPILHGKQPRHRGRVPGQRLRSA